MMRKISFVIFTWGLFLLTVLFLPTAGNAGLPAPPLPPLLIPAPPAVVLIPGTYAYFAPDVDAELVFYGGYWYRFFGGGWYRASHYNGPWGFVGKKRVPGVLINLPPGYRNVPPGHQPIPYGHLKKNWRTWERNKHWDKPGKPDKSDTLDKPGKPDKPDTLDKPVKAGKRKAGKTKKHEQSESGSDKRDRDK